MDTDEIYDENICCYVNRFICKKCKWIITEEELKDMREAELTKIANKIGATVHNGYGDIEPHLSFFYWEEDLPDITAEDPKDIKKEFIKLFNEHKKSINKITNKLLKTIKGIK